MKARVLYLSPRADELLRVLLTAGVESERVARPLKAEGLKLLDYIDSQAIVDYGPEDVERWRADSESMRAPQKEEKAPA